MPQSDTMSFTVILSRGYRFKSFTNEFIMARWVFGLDRRSPPFPKVHKMLSGIIAYLHKRSKEILRAVTGKKPIIQITKRKRKLSFRAGH